MTRLTLKEWQRDASLVALGEELLWQLADDDLLIGFRDQEWLGLAPHIEEDVAFGSIGQEEIGHAAHYYGILEKLGAGKADDLASLRSINERRNAVLLEQPNGTGHFLDNPHYDWAFSIVRHYLHDCWEMSVLAGLTHSRIGELSDASRKILGEKRYHRAHQELWIRTMAERDADSRARLEHGLAQAALWMGDLPSFGRWAEELALSEILPGATALRENFFLEVQAFLGHWDLRLPPAGDGLDGRAGQHTAVLDEALATLSEVYRLDPKANW